MVVSMVQSSALSMEKGKVGCVVAKKDIQSVELTVERMAVLRVVRTDVEWVADSGSAMV